MKIYELTFILNSSLDEESTSAEIKKIEELIKSSNGNVLEVQHLGLKGLAYEIQNQRQGKYVTVYYQAEPAVPSQIENTLKLNESILRFLTLVLRPSEYTPKERKEEASAKTESS